MLGWSAEEMRQWQFARFRSLLSHAYETVPYWRKTLDDLGAVPGDFQSLDHVRLLPPLTKDIINSEGENLHSKKPPPGRKTLKSTGGSTGKNIWFLLDGETHDRRRAAGRLADAWEGVVPGTRLVTLWGASLEQKPSRASEVYDKLANRLFLSVYGVGESELQSYAEKLATFRPRAIIAYPSILLHMARSFGKAKCRRIGAEVIFCSAEALYPPVREELEDLFGAKVRNRYASREFGMIAAEGPEGDGLYAMDMRMLVETAPGGGQDDEGQEKARELIITDLDNRTMPMIRYRILDSAVVERRSGAEPFPLTRFKSIDGRVLDVIVTPEGRAFGGTFFTLIFRPFNRAVDQFQVIQDASDHLTIRIVPGIGYDPSQKDKIASTLREQLGAGTRFDLEEVAEIPRLASGKRRFVVSKINHDAEEAGVQG